MAAVSLTRHLQVVEDVVRSADSIYGADFGKSKTTTPSFTLLQSLSLTFKVLRSAVKCL